MNAPGIAIGALLLLFGRKVFWIFVGAAGFVAGVTLARDVLGPQPDWVVLAAGVVAGLVGALLAVVLQRVAVAVAGFLAGGYLISLLAASLGYADVGVLAWLVGGILGLVLVSALLDPALVVLSSLVGAALVSEGLALGRESSPWVFAGEVALGLVVQLAQLPRSA